MEGIAAIGSVTLGSSVFTPWFPRQADYAVFAYEIILKDASASIAVAVYHKDSEDSGPGSALTADFNAMNTAAGSSTTVFSLDTATADSSGVELKELVRFRITSENEGTPLPLHYRFFETTWYNRGEAS